MVLSNCSVTSLGVTACKNGRRRSFNIFGEPHVKGKCILICIFVPICTFNNISGIRVLHVRSPATAPSSSTKDDVLAK